MLALVMTKQCIKCGELKPSLNFRLKRNTCRGCESKRSVEWAKKNPKWKQRLNKRYFSISLGKKAIYKKTILFRDKFPQKYKAYIAVQSAIRNGSLVRGKCEICGLKKTHAHHDDYSKPLDVRWLCALCHIRVHKYMIAHEEAENVKE